MNIDIKSFALGGIAMLIVCATLLLVMASRINKSKRTALSSAFCPTGGNEAITQALKAIRQKHAIPAMAAALVTSDGIKLAGFVGVRKRGTEIPVTQQDLWHLGSDGKAMTSALVSRLVERGQIRWDSTLAQVFPELERQMNSAFQKVTLLELLCHRAGLPANVQLANYLGVDAQELRLRVARDELAKKPKSAPGTRYIYSNIGYMIVGAIVEKVTGQPWEDSIATEIFKPLQMESAGFGGTGTPGKIDQPWPHKRDGWPMAENGPGMDNPPVMGPAGRIHCSIQDWGRFIQDQLRGARGKPALLKPESYQKLHTPPLGGDYALGWKVVQRGWAGGTALNHAGDNTMNFANVWVAPQRDVAFLVCVNQSGRAAFKATDDAVVAMIALVKEVKTSP